MRELKMRQGYYHFTRKEYEEVKSLAYAHFDEVWKLRFACFDGIAGEMDVSSLEDDVVLIPVKIVEEV